MDEYGDQLEAQAQRVAREAKGKDIVSVAEYYQLRRGGMVFTDALAVFHRALWLHEQGEPRDEH